MIVSLVLVHGLHGGHIKTWTSITTDGKRVVWPRDLLPKKQPRTRVLSFGYMGDIYNNNIIAGIGDNARSLLAHIKIRRRADPDRPIVFIAHCVGGLIVKQALCIASNEEEYISIARATHTVMFFGTPHFKKGQRGNILAIANAYDTLAEQSTTRRRIGSKRSKLADQMMNNELDFVEMSEDFVQVVPALAKIRSFCESLPLRGTEKVIVQPMDTRLYNDQEEPHMIQADHIGMCQFEKVNDPTLLLVRNYIHDAVKKEERGQEEKQDEEVSEEEETQLGQKIEGVSVIVEEAIPRVRRHRGLAGFFSRRKVR
ncbi:hypothetical protein DL765_007101 [Monosporascus sp. GIB2]|nr:hypothetical protein DL765_007101 [Monosporascus sp. GIB2]